MYMMTDRASARTVAASVTRMAIFVQATALRYDPYLDFECRSCVPEFKLYTLVDSKRSLELSADEYIQT